MFTGIIEGVGRVRDFKREGEGAEIEVEVDFDLERTNVGESISVNGCCLTITSRLGKCFWADLSRETLAKTTLGLLIKGAAVNLERALKVGERLGGHIVQGHVDGVGKILCIKELADGILYEIEIPGNLSRYMVDKGSIAIDGVSLTINACSEQAFSVMVVPHTKLKTTFMHLNVGDAVNLEVDIVGKYVEKLTFLDSEQYQKGCKITQEFLRKHGF